MSRPRSINPPTVLLQPSPLDPAQSSPGTHKDVPRHASAAPAPLPADEHAVEGEHALVDTTQQRPFQPFFTLVEDATSQTTVHPSVTYIFADDELDPVTEAALRIQNTQASTSVAALASILNSDPTKQRGSQQEGRRKSSQVEPVERSILLTLTPSGRDVQSFHSLTPDWHVDDVEITPAPTLDSGSDAHGAGSTIGISPNAMASRLRRASGTVSDRLRVEEEREVLRAQREDGPLMLRLHGHGLMPAIGADDAMLLGLDGLREAYAERMEELRRVVAAGEGELEGVPLSVDGQTETG